MEYDFFEESGVQFSLLKENLFRIEKSSTLAAINYKANKDEGIKTAEFLLVDKKSDSLTIWIIEAKTGSPQPVKEEDFNSFINEIKDKFYDSLSLFLAIHLKRHMETLPVSFQEINLTNTKFNLVLIITSKTYKEEWLEPLRDSLGEVLNPTVKKMAKIWNFPASKIMVLNPTMAEQLGLINNQVTNI
jgi:hypothetical protein